MLKVLFIFLVSVITFAANAESLSCSRGMFEKGNDGPDHTWGIIDVLQANCSNGKTIKVQGVGLGLRVSMVSGFTVNCFGDDKSPSRKYYGLKADAGLLLGGSAAIFGSKNGFCVLGGGGLNFIGAAITGSQLVIE